MPWAAQLIDHRCRQSRSDMRVSCTDENLVQPPPKKIKPPCGYSNKNFGWFLAPAPLFRKNFMQQTPIKTIVKAEAILTIMSIYITVRNLFVEKNSTPPNQSPFCLRPRPRLRQESLLSPKYHYHLYYPITYHIPSGRT